LLAKFSGRKQFCNLLLPAATPIRLFGATPTPPPADRNEDEDSTKKDETKQHAKMNRPYKKPQFLDTDYDHLAKHEKGAREQADLDDDDFLPDYLAKDAPTFKRNEVAINLPWLINGAPFNELKTRFMGEQIFSRMKVHRTEVLGHLFKVYRAVLLSAADRDFEFLEQYCEEMFYEKLRNRLN